MADAALKKASNKATAVAPASTHAYAKTLKTFTTASGKEGKFFSLPDLAKYSGRSAASFSPPSHWAVMVVVGSRCQVRNNAPGTNVGCAANAGGATASAPNNRWA